VLTAKLGHQSGLYDVSPELYPVQSLPVADLSVGYTPRETALDAAHVGVLTEVIDLLPPVIVDHRTMMVIDGVHRLEAFRRAGRTHIKAFLFTGKSAEAMALAIKSNIKHGKPLSRSERRTASRSLLGAFPERSDRWIGEICGLSHTTVALIRRNLSNADQSVRTGRDGRRRPVDRLAAQATVARLVMENPTNTVRQVALAAGVAPSTVHRARARLQRPEFSSVAPPSRPATTVSRAEICPPGPQPGIADLAEPVSWLARTAVSVDDLRTHLAVLPISRLYGVVDECRKRAEIWSEIADILENRVRGGLAGKKCLKA